MANPLGGSSGLFGRSLFFLLGFRRRCRRTARLGADELDEAHRRVITAARPLLQDARISATLIGLHPLDIARCDLLKELFDEIDFLNAPIRERASKPPRKERRDLPLGVKATGEHILTLGLIADRAGIHRERITEAERLGEEALGH